MKGRKANLFLASMTTIGGFCWLLASLNPNLLIGAGFMFFGIGLMGFGTLILIEIITKKAGA